MSKYREPKETDEEQIRIGLEYVMEAIKKHPEIEPSLWVSVCMSTVAQSFIDNELTYLDFKEQLENAIKHYKDWWD